MINYENDDKCRYMVNTNVPMMSMSDHRPIMPQPAIRPTNVKHRPHQPIRAMRSSNHTVSTRFPMPVNSTSKVTIAAPTDSLKHQQYDDTKVLKKEYSENQEKNSISELLSSLKISNNKPPVLKLNEIMALKKLPIEYMMVSIAGHEHDPIFTYRAKSNDIVAYGSGKSKKEAKQNSAVAFLDLLDFNSGSDAITSTTSSPPPHSPLISDNPKKLLEVKSETNPIGVLQELCMARHWQLPEYEYLQEIQGEKNSITYKVECSILIYRCIGEGKTKQEAKKQAARLLFDKVKNLSQEKIAALCYNQFHPPQVLPSNNAELLNIQKQQSSCISSDAVKKVETFFNQLKTSSKPSLNALSEMKCVKELGTRAIDMLEKIGQEEGFSISYILLSCKSEKIEVMVQVTLNPLVVYIGTGKTVLAAQESAAFAALAYLKLMLEN